MIENIGSGLVYRNPRPNLRAVHAWHPSIVALGGGELLASFDLGQAAESFDYRTYTSRSTDGGISWDQPVRLFEDDDTDSRPTTHTVRLSRTNDGTLVGFGARFHRDDPDEGLINRKTNGWGPMDLILLKSHDGGHTWTGPTVIEPSLHCLAFEICHRVIELTDGRWLAPVGIVKDWDGNILEGLKGVAFVSSDQGANWPTHTVLFEDSDDDVSYFEQGLTELDGGRLLAVAWVYEESDGTTRKNAYAISEDGRTFASARSTDIHGQTLKILHLGDNQVLCVYRRHDQPGLWANLVRIDGDRWETLHETLLWQGAGSGMAGAQSMGDELSALKFGFPSMTRLSDGELLVVFWCHEADVNNIRWIRIRVG